MRGGLVTSRSISGVIFSEADGDAIIAYLNQLLANERVLFCPLVRSFFEFDLGHPLSPKTDD
jgi:hypothetical protein